MTEHYLLLFYHLSIPFCCNCNNNNGHIWSLTFVFCAIDAIFSSFLLNEKKIEKNRVNLYSLYSLLYDNYALKFNLVTYHLVKLMFFN